MYNAPLCQHNGAWVVHAGGRFIGDHCTFAKFEVSTTLMLGILAIWAVSVTHTCSTFIFVGW